MLQISQTENPMCSATIDQIRLRRAMNLPLEFQNVSFSGFQSEIQVGSLELISRFPFRTAREPSRLRFRRARDRVLGTPLFGHSQLGRMICFRRTASMASEKSYSSFVPSRCGTKNAPITKA